MAKIIDKYMLSYIQKYLEKRNLNITNKIEESKDYTQTLITLLKECKTNIEMCEILKIEPKQLYEELLKLENNGVLYARNYYADGSIAYNSIQLIGETQSDKWDKTEKLLQIKMRII